ncbi:MAG: tRNA 2-selenouridine(34) synthase MnmH [Gammaproteobacteria bacterium]|nr:tRNA 2-selenouridine(34) synthase MnmH [Gammaproteobacteria bacterium]
MANLTSEYERLLAGGIPLLDVRSPGEFARGAFPDAVNLPLLTDDERHRVGIRYKQAGGDAAVELGERLVSGDTRQTRMAAWRSWACAHPEGALYCWRGGLRSQIVQEWLSADGHTPARIVGGFKALRGFCLKTLDRDVSWVVLAGRAGCDKTGILERIPRSVDLEGLANHRGSAFGKRDTPQPPPIAFENALAVRVLQLTSDVAPARFGASLRTPVAVEDESRTIGRLAVPRNVFAGMQRAPVVVVEAPREDRIERIYRGYVAEDEGARARLEQALDNIERRLGGERHRAVRREMQHAFETGAPDRHRAWIALLLDWYYDPMYDYQLAQKAERVAFRGVRADVTEYLARATR